MDIPGKITFMESKTLTAGQSPTVVDTGNSHTLVFSRFELVITQKKFSLGMKDNFI